MGSECVYLSLLPLSVVHDFKWDCNIKETIVSGPVARIRSSDAISRVNAAFDSLPHPLLL